MTETNTSPGVMDNILGWLHRGYPEGVPQKDYFALLALLKRASPRTRSSGPPSRYSSRRRQTR